MSLFDDRAGRALLVIDVQSDVVADAHQRDAVVANINMLVRNARAADVPVVWVQHNDAGMTIESPEWQLVSELEPRAGEAMVNKQYRSSFESTEKTAS